MEVLEYHQKFEIELSNFSDSADTKTRRKVKREDVCVHVWVECAESLLEDIFL